MMIIMMVTVIMIMIKKNRKKKNYNNDNVYNDNSNDNDLCINTTGLLAFYNPRKIRKGDRKKMKKIKIMIYFDGHHGAENVNDWSEAQQGRR